MLGAHILFNGKLIACALFILCDMFGRPTRAHLRDAYLTSCADIEFFPQPGVPWTSYSPEEISVRARQAARSPRIFLLFPRRICVCVSCVHVSTLCSYVYIAKMFTCVCVCVCPWCSYVYIAYMFMCRHVYTCSPMSISMVDVYVRDDDRSC